MLSGIDLKMKQWDWDFFLAERRKVVGLWPTGKQIESPDSIAEDVIKRCRRFSEEALGPTLPRIDSREGVLVEA